MGGRSSCGGRDTVAPCRACHSSRHRGRLSLDASLHDYRLWQSSRSSRHNMGRTLSAFTGCRHNRWTPGQALCLVELVNHILPFILEWHIGRYEGYQWAISLGVEERVQPDTCLVTLALVYKGSHSSSYLKSLGLHLAKQPSLSRWSIQYSPMTVGG